MTNRELKALCRAERDAELKQIDMITEEKTGQVRVISASENEGGKRRIWGTRQKIAAAVIVLAVLAAGTIFGPKVYAQVQAWIKGTMTDKEGNQYNVISVIGSSEQEATWQYFLEWLPERFGSAPEMIMSGSSKEFRCSVKIPWEVYIALPNVNVSGWYGPTPAYGDVPETLGIGFIQGSHDLYFLPEKYIEEEGETVIGEWQVHIYVYTRGDISCIGVSIEHGDAFRIDGNITKEEAVRIIENIRRGR